MNGPTGGVVLVVTAILMLAGLLGTIVPMVPGVPLILAGALLYGIVDGFQTVGWPTLAVLGLLTLIAVSADLWASSAGAKMGGASGCAVVLGMIGGIVGFLIFSLPGAILGAMLCVVLTEVARQNDWKKALKAGSGWLAGWVLSTLLQAGIGVSMIVLFVWQIIQGP